MTAPHKTAIVPLCDNISREAAVVGDEGAVNVMRREADGRLVGRNLDGPSFVSILHRASIQVTGRSAYLVGAGGAAYAIAFALAEAGVGRLTLANRTASKSADLAARLDLYFPNLPVRVGTEDPSAHDLW